MAIFQTVGQVSPRPANKTDNAVGTTGVPTYQDFPNVGGRCPHLPIMRGQESFPDLMSGANTKGFVMAHEMVGRVPNPLQADEKPDYSATISWFDSAHHDVTAGVATPNRGCVEKHDRRHSEERSDVAISLAFNIRDCHAIARNDENGTFSTVPKAGIQKDAKSALRRGGLTFICYFLGYIFLSALAIMAEDTTFVPLKNWWEYTDEEKKFLRNRWTDDRIDAVVTALEERKKFPDFVYGQPSTFFRRVYYDLGKRVVLDYPDLRQISLYKVELLEVDLTSACLQGAILYEAKLQRGSLEKANLQGVSLAEANLTGAHLQGADLREAHLQGAILYEANLQGAILTGAIFDSTLLYRPKLDSTVGYRDIEWRNCYVGDVLPTYRELKRIYRNVGMDELVAEFHYWENWVKTRQISVFEGCPRFLFLELTYGYGSRPWWLLWYSLFVIGLFAVVFYILSLFPRARTGIYMTKQGDSRKRRLTWKQPYESLYASIVAFATVGYGALRPKQWLQFFRMKPVDFEVVGWVRIFVGLEAALGIWVLALLVTVLFGR